MSETIIEYNARCKSWGDTASTGYRDQQAGTSWPTPPAAPANGGAWRSFLDTDCGNGSSYRDWQPPVAANPLDPQYSGGVIGRGPPPGPPAKRG